MIDVDEDTITNNTVSPHNLFFTSSKTCHRGNKVSNIIKNCEGEFASVVLLSVFVCSLTG